ncbi:family 43 glycosylhydrolase [Microbacterium halophytorum]|uniref:family 43 glycosylhydrolase n=1 Tax=Microbacterium halophytorum TaxID=2067568 RepID=UPI00131A1B22|nr:family 43 glycosylhydrolase [Microbacterium halophytorum]
MDIRTSNGAAPPRGGRRRPLALGAACAVTAALLLPVSQTATAAEGGAPVVDYEFTQATGAEVADAAGGEPAVVQNAADAQWTGSSLELTGGAKGGTGNWVRLPNDLLQGADSATITTEVKIDESMKSVYNFLWNIGAENDTDHYFFASARDAARTAITTGSSGAESNAPSSKNLEADRWHSVTASLDGAAGTLSFYVDGELTGQTSTSLTPASITDQSFNTIGRSPWPDPLFAGEVSAFRVYDRALTAEEIATESAADAELNHDEILAHAQGLLDDIGALPDAVESDYLALPTADGQVRWTSSDESVISADGRVTQPEQGADPVTVALTATATVRGISATADYEVVVQPSTATAEERAALAAERYAVPAVLADGASLPAAPDGVVVTPVSATGAALDGDALRLDGDQTADATVTVEVARESAPDVAVSKTFDVSVLPASGAARLAAYHRTPTSEQEANNADVAYSMHLALADGDAWAPLNENYGIFFPKTSAPLPAAGPSSALIRSLKDPAVFAMPGGYGIVGTRIARGGGADGTQTDSVLVATSSDLRSYDEIGLLELDEAGGVNRPSAVYDTADDVYRVSWTTDSGAERHQTFDDIVAAVGGDATGTSASGRATGTTEASGTGIEDFAAGVELTIPQSTADGLEQRFGRVVNTGHTAFDDVSVAAGSDVAQGDLPGTVELEYSDGSTRELPLNEWDLSGVDTTTPGTYEATTTVKRADYPTPFADERADPSAYKYTANGETRYLMVATNDPNSDVVNQRGAAFLPIRSSDTLAGLSDEAGAEEVHLLDRGDVDAHGGEMTGCFWAPELHEIDGRLSILFMPCYNASPDYMTGRASIMQLAQDAEGNDLDPMVPENWSTPEHVTRADGSDLNAVSGISLDMTFFTDADGQAYYAWQQVCATWIAKVDPTDPTRITTDPVMIIEPEYAWDNVCAEGPNVHTRGGKLLMIYSGSSVGDTYTTGLATADAAGSDLTDPASWQKLNYPLQKSGIYDGEWQLGTGHGMWSEDEDGNLIYVFHARTDHNGLTGRDMFVRRVHFDAEGMPVMDMESHEEVANETVTVTVDVTEAAEITADAATRCVAGRNVLAVTVENAGADAATATIATEFGERPEVRVGAGTSVTKSFTTRAAEIAAGEAVVTVGDETVAAPYAASSCG